MNYLTSLFWFSFLSLSRAGVEAASDVVASAFAGMLIKSIWIVVVRMMFRKVIYVRAARIRGSQPCSLPGGTLTHYYR